MKRRDDRISKLTEQLNERIEGYELLYEKCRRLTEELGYDPQFTNEELKEG